MPTPASLPVRRLLGALVLASVASVLAPADAAAQQSQQSPCTDSLYQALRSRALNELSQREYEYFMQREKACSDWQKLNSLVNRSGAAAIPRPAAPPTTQTYSQGDVGGGVNVFVRNTSDHALVVNSVRVYDCENLRAASCGMHFPGTRIRPGESRRVLSIRYASPGSRSSYRYEYNVSSAEAQTEPGGR